MDILSDLLPHSVKHDGTPSSPPSSYHSLSLSPPPMSRDLLPYEVPDPSGRNWLLELPEEILHIMFLQLDLGDITRCFRLCKALNSFLTDSAAINLRHTLLANSLRLNPHATIANPNVPHQMPLTSAKMLAHLRETLTRFRNVAPKSTNRVVFREPSGSLYEYLEGVLLRTSKVANQPAGTKSNTLHVYDLRRIDEWEDTEGVIDDGEEIFETSSDSPMEGDFKTDHTFDFSIAEVATDPTQDLLIIVSVTPLTEPGQATEVEYRMEFHLFSLSTFKPHPKADQHTIEWPEHLPGKNIVLDFQICDDGLYVLCKSPKTFFHEGREADVLQGWQWTSGRRHVQLAAPDDFRFESFVLLTPSSFIVPVAIARLPELNADALRQLRWEHRLYLYSFPPLNDVPTSGEPGHWTPTHVATVDLPPFKNNLVEGVPPLHMCIRTDPPPRHYNSPYPLHAPPPFLPEPESGVAILTITLALEIFPIRHNDLDIATTFNLIVPKTTLIKLLPEPISPILKQGFSRPVPVMPWARLAPNCRLFGPDRVQTGWVCYVYQNRYVSPYARVVGRMERIHDDEDDEEDDEDDEEREIIDLRLQVYDFDARRARKEKLERARRLPKSVDVSDEKVEGDVDGIELVLSETIIPAIPVLFEEDLVTGKNMPFIKVEKETRSVNPLIDGQRILELIPRRVPRQFHDLPDWEVSEEEDSDDDEDEEGTIQIMEF